MVAVDVAEPSGEVSVAGVVTLHCGWQPAKVSHELAQRRRARTLAGLVRKTNRTSDGSVLSTCLCQWRLWLVVRCASVTASRVGHHCVRATT
jgi:hypothetical protein